MPETVATERQVRIIIAVVGLMVAFVLVVGAVVVLRVRVTYDLQSQFNQHRIEHEQLTTVSAVQNRDVIARVDSLERVLFGDVVTKLMEQENKTKPIAPPVRLQQWMVNRDKDMRERLERIERRLLQIESGK
jgi:hypothetical protein